MRQISFNYCYIDTGNIYYIAIMYHAIATIAVIGGKGLNKWVSKPSYTIYGI